MTCRDLWTYNCISLHIWFCPSVPQHPNLLSPAVDWGCGRNHSEFTWNIHLHMILKSSSSSKNRKLFMVFSFSPFFLHMQVLHLQITVRHVLVLASDFTQTIHSKSDSTVLYAWFFGHLLWDCNGLGFLLQATDGAGESIDSDHRRTKPSKKMGGKKNQNDDCECLGNSCKHKWQIPIYPLSDSAGAKILSRPIYHCFSFTQLGMGPVGLRKSWNQTFARPNIAITKCQPMTNASDVGIVAEICDMAPCFWVLGRSMEPPQKSATAANHQQLLYPSLWVCQLALRFWNHGGAFCRPPSPLLQPSFARSLSLHLGLAEF